MWWHQFLQVAPTGASCVAPITAKSASRQTAHGLRLCRFRRFATLLTRAALVCGRLGQVGAHGAVLGAMGGALFANPFHRHTGDVSALAAMAFYHAGCACIHLRDLLAHKDAQVAQHIQAWNV